MITSYSVLDSDIQRRIALDVSQNLKEAISRVPDLHDLIHVFCSCDVDVFCDCEFFVLVKNEKLLTATGLVLARI